MLWPYCGCVREAGRIEVRDGTLRTLSDTFGKGECRNLDIDRTPMRPNCTKANKDSTRNKFIASSNKCLTSSNKKLLETIYRLCTGLVTSKALVTTSDALVTTDLQGTMPQLQRLRLPPSAGGSRPLCGASVLE